MSDMVWVINSGKEDLEIIDMDALKWIIMHPGRPQQVSRHFALKNIGKIHDFRSCDNPEKYFTEDNKLRHLIIRDAGIGDLLLLEPIIREFGKSREITIKTKYQDIFKYHPSVYNTIFIDSKHNNKDFDCWDDLRSYSETASTRTNKHRTDIYNEVFQLNLKDKEPRIYIDESTRNPIIKKEGYKYFAIQCDASHSYRRYDKGEELAYYIINADEKNIAIILGGYDFIKLKNRHDRIIDMQGKTSVLDMIMIIKDSDYFIGGDSGLLHVACSLHTPAVGLFSIITPDLRLRYYTGPYKAIVKEGLQCIGCGNHHMEVCNFGNKKQKPEFISPCMDITPEFLYKEVVSLPNAERRIFIADKKEESKDIKEVNIIKNYNGQKLTMPIIVQDEAKNLPRFIELVMKHPAIGRVIAIDGGSKDNTVELLSRAGAEVYVHPYIKTYHDQQAMQRNISFSYVSDGTPCIFMDIDECFSKELSDYLYFLAEQKDIRYGLISRRTFNYYSDIIDSSKQIKDYPDFQPRFYIWDKKFKFINGAHHWTLNCPEPVKIQKDIIHFEKEGKDREQIEAQWKYMMDGVKKYGL
jgi:ADP-heptose:LPS heptosyltransferase